MKKRLKILIPIIVGFFFIYLTFELTSPEERALIISYIGSAKIEFVLAAMLLGASADVIRGLRWQLLSKSLGYKSNKLISIASVFMCYTSNMAIARSGEFVRASVLSSYNNIPIGKTLGTIAAERVVDICISLLILISIWVLQYELIIESLFDDELLLYINENIAVVVFVILAFIIVSIILIKKIERLRKFFNTILEGLLSVTKLKSKIILSAFMFSLNLLE